MPNEAAHQTGPDKGDKLKREAPNVLSEFEQDYWYEIYDRLDHDYCGEADALALEDFARLGAKLATGDANTSQEVAYRKYLDAFGLTPAGRKRLLRASGQNIPKDHSKLAKFK